MREHRIQTRYYHPLIEHRNNERRVIYIEYGADPVKELAPCLPLIRALSQFGLQRRICRTYQLDFQL